ncbi:hypothetical protein [Streptomyces sp. NBC_00236]|uniref:hypothetical protein n=1 Tax=unclassified Streptomyces TaxID=2593676 RepID=UPI002E2A9771|nr:hypothetical protein [Streptomyces sp. NBC_00236]
MIFRMRRSLAHGLSDNSEDSDRARAGIKRSDPVILVCGKHTGEAVGVDIELGITQEKQVAYCLLNGHSGKKPTTTKTTAQVYDLTWGNLKKLVGGAR